MANTIIPAVGTRGRFTLKSPFAAAMTPNTLYRLTAVRQFNEIESLGQNIYQLFYKPFNLTEQDLQTDRANNPTIVTLMSDSSTPLYVPLSYVQSFPDLSFVPYSQYILTFSCGALPDSVLLDPTIAALKAIASDFLGVQPEVYVASMPLSDSVTPEDNDNREAVRQAAITNRDTDYAKLYEANATIATQQQRIAILEKIVKDNGLLP